MNDCRQLLAEFARTHSESAFRELVSRYLNLVYSTALRLVDGDEHRARDVAQVVFADLARKAGELAPEIMLGGWLHRHACFVATNTMRGERRRLAREREAVEMNALHEAAEPDFARLAPLLDETINQLEEADRTAILLRFFEQKDFRAVGQSLASSEDAARMRVNRALDKLRDLLAQRGIRTTASALGVVISAQAIQAAPAGLAAAITTTVLAGSAVTTTTLLATTTKTIAMTTLQKSLLLATFAVLTGAGIHEARQAAQLRDQVQTLQQQQAPLAEQLRQLQGRLADATNRLANVLADNSQLRSNPNQTQLLKLRGEVTRLQNDALLASDPIVKKALLWKANVEKMKQLFSEHPEQEVPEMKLLSEQYFFDLARDQDLESSNGVRKAFSEIRMRAKNTFAYPLQTALKKYVDENNGQLPATMSELKSYFDTPPDDAMLDQYKLLYTGNISEVKGNFVVRDKQVIDPEFDDAWQVGPNGYGPDATGRASASMQATADALAPAIKAYMDANGGNQPARLDQLKPFLATPDQQTAYEDAAKSDLRISRPK